MHYKEHWSRRLFVIVNGTLLLLIMVLCLFPLVHVLAVSFSSGPAAAAGKVVLWPVDFTTSAYEFALSRPAFRSSIIVSVQRVILGVIVNMLLTVLVAYPLSRESSAFPARTFYAWFFIVTMLVSGGLIPLYMIVRWTGLLDSIWALVLPTAVPVFNVVLLLNFFRGLPRELEEAAFIDGAGHWTVLFKIYLPLSMPALATLTLFSFVTHWNSWFDGLIFMNSPQNYPLQSYLQTLVISRDISQLGMDTSLLKLVSDQTFKAAQIFIGALPIIIIYPFLQRYFVKGIVLGSIKG